MGVLLVIGISVYCKPGGSAAGAEGTIGCGLLRCQAAEMVDAPGFGGTGFRPVLTQWLKLAQGTRHSGFRGLGGSGTKLSMLSRSGLLNRPPFSALPNIAHTAVRYALMQVPPKASVPVLQAAGARPPAHLNFDLAHAALFLLCICCVTAQNLLRICSEFALKVYNPCF